jgi:hypothetical protein
MSSLTGYSLPARMLFGGRDVSVTALRPSTLQLKCSACAAQSTRNFSASTMLSR